MITVYKLTVPDDCEGRSSHTVGYFRHSDIATKVGESGYKNSLAGPPWEFRVFPIKICESLDAFVRDHPDVMEKLPTLRSRITKAALDKLTESEKTALKQYFEDGGKP